MKIVRGPEGEVLTLASLPPAGGGFRWSPMKKARVVHALRGGLLSIEDTRKLWNLDADELAEWTRDYDKHGVKGLKSTKLAERRYA